MSAGLNVSVSIGNLGAGNSLSRLYRLAKLMAALANTCHHGPINVPGGAENSKVTREVLFYFVGKPIKVNHKGHGVKRRGNMSFIDM